MRVIIIHGTGGSPEGNWFPWLSQKLSEMGIATIVPRFATLEGQSLFSWYEQFEKEVGTLKAGDVVIGHSIGCAFACSLLEKSPMAISACYLIAPFVEFLGLDFDRYKETFINRDFDWQKIRTNSKKFFVYYGDNDPYVPASMSELVAQYTGATKFCVGGGGHLNAESGYITFDALFESILTLATPR